MVGGQHTLLRTELHCSEGHKYIQSAAVWIPVADPGVFLGFCARAQSKTFRTAEPPFLILDPPLDTCVYIQGSSLYNPLGIGWCYSLLSSCYVFVENTLTQNTSVVSLCPLGEKRVQHKVSNDTFKENNQI